LKINSFSSITLNEIVNFANVTNLNTSTLKLDYWLYRNSNDNNNLNLVFPFEDKVRFIFSEILNLPHLNGMVTHIALLSDLEERIIQNRKNY